jgi:hypothetical protein
VISGKKRIRGFFKGLKWLIGGRSGDEDRTPEG